MPNMPKNEQVRIFVEFADLESGYKAVEKLDGRFFAGKPIKATFYDPEKFYSIKLDEEV